MKSDEAGDLWLIFFHGDLRSMAAHRCSRCGGLLQWSPYIHQQTREYRGEQKHPMGLSIYCRGTCDHMIAHLDGVAPDWALGVADWDAFNHELEATKIAEQAGAGQPATRPESKLEGSDKPQPEAEGRSR